MTAAGSALGWVGQVVSLELRKVFTYRFTFWVKVLVGTVTDVAVAYYLWGAVFAATGAETLGGYTYRGMVYYAVFASLGANVVRTLDRGVQVSDDIYQGGLSRYLVYPVPYFVYRYATYFGQQLICVFQLLVGAVVAVAIWGVPSDAAITPGSIALGIATALVAGAALFLMMLCLEMVAFWQDTVWNLIAMLRFIGNLVGGLMVPISLFPEWGRTAAAFTPFPAIYSFPIRCFLGQVDGAEWIRSMGALVAWILALSAMAAWIWRKGTRTYSGVGI